MEIIGSEIQIEDGDFTRLHNLILDALAVARFTATEYRVIIFLLRKTYGYNKKDDDLSLSQWEEGTNTSRANISHTLAGLIEKNVIYRLDSTRPFCHRYCFNKYIENWDDSLFDRRPSRANLVSEHKENLVSEHKESTNLVSEHKKILCNSTNNKRQYTKDKLIEVPPRPKREPKPAQERDDVAQGWFAAVCWLVHGHRDFDLLSIADRVAIGKTVKAIRASPNAYTIDDLRAWYRDIWSKEWPGRQRDKDGVQPPTLKQIKTGIGRTRSDVDTTFVKAMPEVLDISLGGFL